MRYETDIMKSLRSTDTLQESVQLFWNRIGRDYLVASQQSYLNDEHRGCYALKFEDLAKDFDGTIRRMLRVFGISSAAVEDRLVKTIRRHDRSNISKEQEKLLAKDMHVSSKKFSSTMIKEVERILLEEIEESGELIRSMRKEMESLTQAPQLLEASLSSEL